jgi:16S rRNA (uracil1498-N3)-methyltransferase
MRIPRLYTEHLVSPGSLLELDKNASNYLLKVLRLADCAPIHVFNGQSYQGTSGCYESTLQISGKSAVLSVNSFIPDSNESPLKITLLQGVSKGDHMDLTIQKAVELGVTEIIPLICERTVVNLKADRLDKKMRHWQGIITSASEQCGRNTLLKLHEPLRFNKAELPTDTSGFILQPSSDKNFSATEKTSAVALVIGPEGGFTDEEIQTAINKGFQEVRFGPRVLRTETAAIAAVSIMQSLWGDLN